MIWSLAIIKDRKERLTSLAVQNISSHPQVHAKLPCNVGIVSCGWEA
jgi:hypothetical protein